MANLKNLIVRVSEAELEAVRKMAETHGQTVAGYVRQAIKLPPSPKPGPIPKVKDKPKGKR